MKEIGDGHQNHIVQENEELYRNLVEGMPFYFTTFLPGGKLTYVNSSLADSVGMTQADLVGMNFFDFLPASDKPMVKAQLDSLTPMQSVETHEQTYIDAKTGMTTSHRWTNRAFFDATGRVTYFQAVGENVTELKKLETELRESEKQLIQSSKLALLGEISAGIVHEIKNPLTSISLAIDLIPRYLNDIEKLEEKLKKIKKNIARIATITSGLSKLSHNSGYREYNNSDLSKIVLEAVSLTQSKSDQASTPVHCELRGEHFIHCNETEIEQVLINLLVNAIDAVKDLDEKWVKIEIKDDALNVILRVTDSGHGIPVEAQNRIFEPFFTTKTLGEGTGLGLSITKRILDEHNATIRVVSDMPNTCFEIKFTS